MDTKVCGMLQWLLFYEKESRLVLTDDKKRGTFIPDFWKTNFWKAPITQAYVWSVYGMCGDSKVKASHGGIDIEYRGEAKWFHGVAAAKSASAYIDVNANVRFYFIIIAPTNSFPKNKAMRVTFSWGEQRMDIRGKITQVSCEENSDLYTMSLDLETMQSSLNIEEFIAREMEAQKGITNTKWSSAGCLAPSSTQPRSAQFDH